jgi:peptidoglycan hydrolase-like protein with peptidoglycan-binding domain
MRQYTQETAVRNLQKYLRQLSYTDLDIPPVPIDGIFGEATTASLKAFQKKNGFVENGIADRESWDALYESYLESVKRFSPPLGFSPFPMVPEGYALAIGEIGFAVSSVQFLLGEISSVIDGIGELPITGLYNIDTSRAVAFFQAASGLDVTGAVDKLTWDALVDTYERFGKDYRQ